MKKSLLVLTAAGVLTLNGVFAQDTAGSGYKHDGKQMMVKDRSDKVRIDNGDKADRHIDHQDIPFLLELDLTNEQKEQINTYQKELFAKIKTIFDNKDKVNYFGATSFDKEAFLSSQKERSNLMIELKADYLEKVYEILTVEQKSKIPEIFATKNEKIRKK
jgi:Spy/CpxP family protein refolding chaperone